MTAFLGTGHILQALDIATPAKYEFLEQLMTVLPPAFAEEARVQFCGPTGADAVEAALKLFRTATGRRSVVAFHGAYHGMTAGALGMMGNLGHQRYDKWAPGAHAGTFRGNQIALAAGAATMQYLKMQDLPAQAEARGRYFRAQLADLAARFPCIGEIRGRGLMLGAEIVQPTGGDTPDGALAKRIKRACFEAGVIVETGGRHGAVLRLLPALTITEREIDEAMERIRSAFARVLAAERPTALA